MLRPRIAVLISWILTTLVLGTAIFSTPYMQRVLRGEAVESASESIVAVIVVSVICSRPWLKAFVLPTTTENQSRQYLFAVIAIVLACAFYLPISRGQDFSIGLHILLPK